MLFNPVLKTGATILDGSTGKKFHGDLRADINDPSQFVLTGVAQEDGEPIESQGHVDFYGAISSMNLRYDGTYVDMQITLTGVTREMRDHLLMWNQTWYQFFGKSIESLNNIVS